MDIILLGALAVLIFLYTIYFGKSKAVAIILSFYISILLYDNFTFLKNVLIFRNTAAQLSLSRLIIFAIIFILIFLTLKYFIHNEFSSRRSWTLLKAALLSLSAIDLALVVCYYVVPVQRLYDFSPSIDSLFGNQATIFWWLIAPLIVLFICRD